MKRVWVLSLLVACNSFDAVDGVKDDAGADGSSPADASSDVDAGGPDGDAAKASSCASVVPPNGESVIYCRDFDDGRAAIESWSLTSAEAGVSSIALDPENVTPPFSFRARIEANAPNCTYARGIVETGAMRATSHVSFDIRLGGVDTDPADGQNFMSIESGTCGLIFGANPSKASVTAQIASTNEPYDIIDRYPRAGTWSHVEATVHRDTNELEVAVDGVSALVGGKVKLPAGCLLATSKLQLRVGMHCEPSITNPREVRIDNVVVTGTAN